MNEQKNKPLPKEKLTPIDIDKTWGKSPEDHFGYANEEERLAKRGMEDWELLESIPDSQKPIPKWFLGVVIVVLLLAIGLSFPFWGDRPGYEREWINSGFLIAIVYLLVAGTFVHYMVKMYGSKIGGRLDLDKTEENEKQGKSSDA